MDTFREILLVVAALCVIGGLSTMVTMITVLVVRGAAEAKRGEGGGASGVHKPGPRAQTARELEVVRQEQNSP